VAARAGFDAAPFVRVIQHARGQAKVAPDRAADLLAGYLAGMERLAAYVDRFDGGVRPSAA
jgi:hypothetical protein